MSTFRTHSSSCNSTLSYNTLNSCDVTLGADNLLQKFINDKNYILNLIYTDPSKLVSTIWTTNGPLSYDTDCLCKMGTGDRRSAYTCAQCKNFNRLVDFRYNVINDPFLIHCGQLAGSELTISKFNNKKLFLQYDNAASSHAKLFVNKFNKLRTCGTPNVDNLKCIVGDSFTINTLISFIISDHFEKYNIPNYRNLYTSYICGTEGYFVHNTTREIPFNELFQLYNISAKDVVFGIILQLLVVLTELSKLNFSHGNPTFESLYFYDIPVSYIYNGVQISYPFMVSLGKFENSSITINNTHYYTKNMSDVFTQERGVFIPEIVTKTVQMAYCALPGKSNENLCYPTDANVYKLTNSTLDIYYYIRHIGFPLYVGSFDFYSFMSSLMSNPIFSDTCYNNTSLYEIWSMMWLEEDFNSSLDHIRGKWLRCDIINLIWSVIKNNPLSGSCY